MVAFRLLCPVSFSGEVSLFDLSLPTWEAEETADVPIEGTFAAAAFPETITVPAADRG